MSPNSGGTSPSLALNSAIAQSGGRDAGTFSGMTAVRSETSECLALKIQNGKILCNPPNFSKPQPSSKVSGMV
jgi:hypothetical protein